MYGGDQRARGSGSSQEIIAMNILYVVNHLNVGGITSYCMTLATGMKKKGHSIFIASSGGQLLGKFTDEGFQYIPIPIDTKKEVGPKILACAFKLLSAVRKNNIDIVHTHSRTTQVVGCLVSRKTGVLHVTTWHGFFKKRLFRRLFPCWADKVIAISEPVKEHLISDFKVDEARVRVIHNGIDVVRFQPNRTREEVAIKTEFGLRGGPVIGIVGRLSDVKGHSYLIEAMRTIAGAFPHAQLLIVGEGKMQKELVNLVTRMGIEKNVFFVHSVLNTARVLSIMDVFVMPSLKEGLGLALMEAMASGLAVVGSDIGGIKSLIRNGENGFLVKPQDSAALSCAIMELLKDPQMRQRFGSEARKSIQENFSETAMVDQTERLYQECVHARN